LARAYSFIRAEGALLVGEELFARGVQVLGGAGRPNRQAQDEDRDNWSNHQILRHRQRSEQQHWQR
jgi:hypothetical protein